MGLAELPRLSSSLGVPSVAPVNKGGRKGKTFDCGRHGNLTISQIAKIAGISYYGVRMRIDSGWQGAALCLKAGSRNAKRGETRYPTMLAALKIARAFPDTLPSVEQIRKVHPVGQSTAKRWRNVLRAVLEAEGVL